MIKIKGDIKVHKISDFNIMTQEEVERIGIEFAGEVTWDSKYGYQILDKDEEDGGKPINGYLYEKFKSGNLIYYSMYEDGLGEGEFVEFYESGQVWTHSQLSKGVHHGVCIEWYENNNIKRCEKRAYGILETYIEWDENGNIVKQVTETTDENKKLIQERRRLYEKR